MSSKCKGRHDNHLRAVAGGVSYAMDALSLTHFTQEDTTMSVPQNQVLPQSTFGKFMYDKRTRMGISQAHLAKLIGADQAQVSRWEGGSSPPTSRMVPKIMRALQFSANEKLVAIELLDA